MYVRDDQACSVANGELPVSQASIDAANARRGELSAAMEKAYAAMARAVTRAPEDFSGLDLKARFEDALSAGVPGLRDRPWPEGARVRRCLTSAPLPAGYTPLRPTQLAPVPGASPPAAARAPSGDLCADLRDGLVLASEVSTATLYDCSLRGYVGVQPSPYEVARRAAPAGMSGLSDSFVGSLAATLLVLWALGAWARRGGR